MSNKIVNKLDLDGFSELTRKIIDQYNVTEEEAEEYALKLGPKKLRSLGALENSYEWRENFTKSPIKKKRKHNRKKNKMSKNSRKANR